MLAHLPQANTIINSLMALQLMIKTSFVQWQSMPGSKNLEINFLKKNHEEFYEIFLEIFITLSHIQRRGLYYSVSNAHCQITRLEDVLEC